MPRRRPQPDLASARRAPGSRRARLAIATLATALLAAAALAGLAGLAGCERAPAAPTWDNPFDPAGPDDGDPLGLRAIVGSGSITLSWLQPQGLGIAEYAISHATSADGPWSGLALVTHTSALDNIYLFADPEPTGPHWFRIQAINASGQASLADYATPVGADLGPRVILADGASTVASRFVTMKVIVSRGTTLRVALGPTYATEVEYPAAAPGDTAVIALAAPAAAQGDSVRVRVIATDGAFTSAPTLARARIDFSPEFALQGGGTTVASRTVTLAVPATGVTQMRFAGAQAGLAGAAWVPGAATHTQELLGPQATAQEIWAEFAGDFGFSHVAHITVTPDLLAGATFRLAVPEDRVTAESTVRGILGGKATLVRWSESPDLAAAAWVAHQDTLDIALSPAAGLKTIYLQMRNDWSDSPVLTDWAVLVARGVEVAFLAPQDAATVTGGVTLQVRGTAYGATEGLDAVEVDLGDGTFVAASGLESWTVLWDVPEVAEPTEYVLRARATAADQSATAAVTVTVVP